MYNKEAKFCGVNVVVYHLVRSSKAPNVNPDRRCGLGEWRVDRPPTALPPCNVSDRR